MDANGLRSDFVLMESLRGSSRRQTAETLLRSLPVKKDFNVFRDLFLGFVAGREFSKIDEFVFSESQNDSIDALTLLCRLLCAESAKSARMRG